MNDSVNMSFKDMSIAIVLNYYTQAYGDDYKDYITNVFKLADEFGIRGLDKMAFAEALRVMLCNIDYGFDGDDANED